MFIPGYLRAYMYTVLPVPHEREWVHKCGEGLMVEGGGKRGLTERGSVANCPAWKRRRVTGQRSQHGRMAQNVRILLRASAATGCGKQRNV